VWDIEAQINPYYYYGIVRLNWLTTLLQVIMCIFTQWMKWENRCSSTSPWWHAHWFCKERCTQQYGHLHMQTQPWVYIAHRYGFCTSSCTYHQLYLLMEYKVLHNSVFHTECIIISHQLSLTLFSVPPVSFNVVVYIYYCIYKKYCIIQLKL
jgi:hypothetical protein